MYEWHTPDRTHVEMALRRQVFCPSFAVDSSARKRAVSLAHSREHACYRSPFELPSNCRSHSVKSEYDPLVDMMV